MKLVATLLLFDDAERFDALLAWARAHDTLVCVVANDDFAPIIQHSMSMDLPEDLDLLSVNGGVVQIELPFSVI